MVFTGLVISSLVACDLWQAGEEEPARDKALARVYDRYLYPRDIEGVIPPELSGADSLAFLQNYLNVWAKDQLMIYKAEYNLTESKKNFEKQIQEYRNDLLKFAYRQEYIRQNLDTTVTEEELRTYYQGHDANFRLQENIVQANYMILDKNAPELKQARKWFFSDEEEDRIQLDDYALKYAFRFSLQDSSWMRLDQLSRLLSLRFENAAEFLEDGPREWEDDTNLYLLEVEAYKMKGDRAPLAYAREITKNILLNKRKLELIEKLEQNLLSDAQRKNEFEVY